MLPVPFQIFVVLIIGLMLGSFTTALSHRVGRGEGWVKGRSCCPSCGATLSIRDLVPLFSWLALRGRCRHCGAAISFRYPLIELALLACSIGVYAVYGFTAAAFILMAALPFLAALLLIDLKQFILPDILQAVLAMLGLSFIVFTASHPPVALVTHTAAAGVFALLVWLLGKAVSLLRRKQALGFGDVKFFAVAGLWLGLASLPIFLITSGVAGIIFGLGWRLTGHKERFPFGPALIAAFYACVLLKGGRFLDLVGV